MYLDQKSIRFIGNYNIIDCPQKPGGSCPRSLIAR